MQIKPLDPAVEEDRLGNQLIGSTISNLLNNYDFLSKDALIHYTLEKLNFQLENLSFLNKKIKEYIKENTGTYNEKKPLRKIKGRESRYTLWTKESRKAEAKNELSKNTRKKKI